MDYILKTNNDLKYIIKKYGAKGLSEVVSNDLIYRYKDDYYFSLSKYKVETNILIQIIKILFKNKFFIEATKLLSKNTYFVTQIKEIKKYSFLAYEYYFLGMSLKELNPKAECFTQIIRLPDDILMKINKLNDLNERIIVLQLYNKFLDKIIDLYDSIPLSIYNIENNVEQIKSNSINLNQADLVQNINIKEDYMFEIDEIKKKFKVIINFIHNTRRI